MEKAANPANATQDVDRWHLRVASVLLVLNLVDAIFTMVWIQSGHAVEANPLMRELLYHSPMLFVVSKTALVSLGVYLLWSRRTDRLARAGLVALTVTYLALFGYHLHATAKLMA